MKKTFRILAGVTAVAIVATVIYRRKNRNTGHMSRQVSDEGYETAHDVLFPKESGKGKYLRYGPVIPR
ncbi:MAG: hypothetical protein ABI402_10755 [Ferruginibacter sp.]